jgi:hypothetical protein
MNTKQLSLTQLYDSNTYVKEGIGFDFKSAKDYVQPFIDRVQGVVSNAEFEVHAVTGAINKDEEDQKLNISYGRFLIEAHMPKEYDVIDCRSKIGLIVALDNQKPLVKVFSGKDVRACMNLTIFNAENIFAGELASIGSVYGKAEDYAKKMGDELIEFQHNVEKLQALTFKGKDLDAIIGNLVKYAMKYPKLGITPVLTGTKDLFDTKSKYALVDGQTTGWNYYNAITEAIKKADISDQATKTVLTSRAFLQPSLN